MFLSVLGGFEVGADNRERAREREGVYSVSYLPPRPAKLPPPPSSGRGSRATGGGVNPACVSFDTCTPYEYSVYLPNASRRCTPYKYIHTYIHTCHSPPVNEPHVTAGRNEPPPPPLPRPSRTLPHRCRKHGRPSIWRSLPPPHPPPPLPPRSPPPSLALAIQTIHDVSLFTTPRNAPRQASERPVIRPPAADAAGRPPSGGSRRPVVRRGSGCWHVTKPDRAEQSNARRSTSHAWRRQASVPALCRGERDCRSAVVEFTFLSGTWSSACQAGWDPPREVTGGGEGGEELDKVDKAGFRPKILRGGLS